MTPLPRQSDLEPDDAGRMVDALRGVSVNLIPSFRICSRADGRPSVEDTYLDEQTAPEAFAMARRTGRPLAVRWRTEWALVDLEEAK